MRRVVYTVILDIAWCVLQVARGCNNLAGVLMEYADHIASHSYDSDRW